MMIIILAVLFSGLFITTAVQQPISPIGFCKIVPIAPALSISGFIDIYATLKQTGTVRVIVQDTTPSDLTRSLVLKGSLKDAADVAVQRRVIKLHQDTVLARIS